MDKILTDVIFKVAIFLKNSNKLAIEMKVKV
jgi:hypothetical protein